MTCTSCGDTLALGVVACPGCGELLAGPEPDPPRQLQLRPIRRLGAAVVVLLGGWIVVELFMAVIDMLRVTLVGRVLVDPASVDPAAITVNDTLYLSGLVARAVFFLATTVAFLWWLFRARDNAERATDARHRRGQLWLILGWGVPAVALWFPKQIVDDIWRASDPATPLDGHVVDGHRKPLVVRLWWVCWLLFWAGSVLMSVLSRVEGIAGMGELESMRASTAAEIAAAPFGIAAAVFAALIVRKISAFQETRRTDHVSVPLGGPIMH